MTNDVLAEIAAERKRQIEVWGFSAKHDNSHPPGRLAKAAACYALSSLWWMWNDYGVAGLPLGSEIRAATLEKLPPPLRGPVYGWPFSLEWWRPRSDRRDLIRAAALIVAEIERIDRCPVREEET